MAILLARDLRPGEALRPLASGVGHASPAFGIQGEIAQRLPELDRVPDGHEQAVLAVAYDVAVAGDL